MLLKPFSPPSALSGGLGLDGFVPPVQGRRLKEKELSNIFIPVYLSSILHRHSCVAEQRCKGKKWVMVVRQEQKGHTFPPTAFSTADRICSPSLTTTALSHG